MREIAVFTLVWVLFAGAAHAQDAEGRARTAYREGMVLYEKGQYREAIAKLREADDVLRAPALAFNIAQAYRLAGECRLAVVYYRAYLERDPEAKNKKLVDDHIINMEKCVADAEAKARAKTDAEARALADAEAKKKAEEEAKRKAEEDARLAAEAEAKRKAEAEEKARLDEEARIAAEAEAKRKAA